MGYRVTPIQNLTELYVIENFSANMHQQTADTVVRIAKKWHLKLWVLLLRHGFGIIGHGQWWKPDIDPNPPAKSVACFLAFLLSLVSLKSSGTILGGPAHQAPEQISKSSDMSWLTRRVISHFVTLCCALSAKVCPDHTERVMTNYDGRLIDVTGWESVTASSI